MDQMETEGQPEPVEAAADGSVTDDGPVVPQQEGRTMQTETEIDPEARFAELRDAAATRYDELADYLAQMREEHPEAAAARDERYGASLLDY